MAKLFGVETSFTNYRKTAKPGYISSTQYNIVTGTHAVHIPKGQDADLYRTGRAVYLHDFSIEDGCGEVSILDDPTKSPFGVLAMSHVYSPKGKYNDGDIANIISFGCVYMICSSNIEFDKITYGRPVSIMRGWGSVVNSDNLAIPGSNLIATRWYFTGAVEFGVNDERFGKVNVAEVMVIPGAALQQPETVVPKVIGHKKHSDADWYGYGATYLLPNKEVEAGKQVTFDFFVNVIDAAKLAFKNDANKIANIKKVSRVAFSYNGDPTRPTDSQVTGIVTTPAINEVIDISDGVGKAGGSFNVLRRQYDDKIPTWCVANFVYMVEFEDAAKYPTERITASFKVRFEV